MGLASVVVLFALLGCRHVSNLDTPIARENTIFVLQEDGRYEPELGRKDRAAIIRMFKGCVWLKGYSVIARSPDVKFELRDEMNPDYRQGFSVLGDILQAPWRESICLLSEEDVLILLDSGRGSE